MNGFFRVMNVFSFRRFFAVVVLVNCIIGGLTAYGQTDPDPPVITEPSFDGKIVSPSDVHMETLPMSDADPGNTHQCTDWEIWTAIPSERVWITSCIGGLEREHTHLADGTFEGSYAGRSELEYDKSYQLRVRHRDNTNRWSAYSVRLFQTGSQTVVFPMTMDDIDSVPVPSIATSLGDPIVLPGGGDAPFVRFESSVSDLLLEIRGDDGVSNLQINPSGIENHLSLRARIYGGGSGVVQQQFTVDFNDAHGVSYTIYFPALNVGPGATILYWISQNGSTYLGDTSQTDPDFSQLAQGAPVPWKAVSSGYKVEIIATGFQLPVNIAFVPNPGSQSMDPLFYVTELYGTIKVVTNNGTVLTYADSLLNFNPTGNFPGSGEQGLSGIAVDSATGDVFANLLYDANPPSANHYPKVVRFQSSDGGLTASTQTTILDMPGETQGQSHFISNLTIGPDRKLYVHMGDGFSTATAQDLNYFRGKILRVNMDGTAPSDNPFYNASNGITARDYVFAYGVRNPFGGAWRASDGFHYEVENGPEVDRFAKIVSGVNYGWDGSNASMSINALYNWNPSTAPVNIAFIEQETFGGSGFESEKMDHAFVSLSGPTWATGPQSRGKRIEEFVLNDTGQLISGPKPFLQYTGSGKATISALAAGPDGLYFSDLYKDLDYVTPIDRGANILRVKYIGRADFSADYTSGLSPLPVQFTDQSDVPGASSWSWTFGDGGTSTAQHPTHTYTAPGIYTVKLIVAGSNGSIVEQKRSYIVIGDIPIGLRGEYYDNIDFTGDVVVRLDSSVNFSWGSGSPDPSMGSDLFSVRWTGRVSPQYSEVYRFYTTIDDGVRLWVDGRLMINQWFDGGPREFSDTISLQAGKRYDVKMEYYENGGGAVASLSWSSPSVAKQIIPFQRWYSSGTTKVFAASNKWNMLSNPMTASNDSVSHLFPAVLLPVYSYSRENGFEPANRVPPGPGYWMKFDSSSVIGVFGDILDSIEVPVDSGWNIIGSVTAPLAAGSIIQNPPGNILSFLYGYNSGYFVADTIQPGKGYWVKTAHPGTLKLSSSAIASSNYSSAYRLLAELNTLKLTDAAGSTQTLYFGDPDGLAEKIPVSSFPQSPAAVFDPRFEPGDLIKTYNGTEGSPFNYAITVSSAVYPLTIDWKLQNTSANAIGLFTDDGKPLLEQNGRRTDGRVVVKESLKKFFLRIFPAAEMPSQFRLEQNYPNPFNPVTVISYLLPVNSYTTLKIYDILGREVKTLVDEIQEAGSKSVRFDATGMASGVYTYRLVAGNISETRKMVLMK